MHELIPEERIGEVRTKIVATVGPASREPSLLRAMVRAGVDVFRLNFSHGTHDEHSAVLESIRAVETETGRRIAVLQDLSGPKIRLGPIPGGAVDCGFGEEFVLASERDETLNDPRWLTSTYATLPDDLELGQTVLFADGTVAMEVTSRGNGWARLKVTLPGRIRSNQGINVPTAALSVAALTPKDLDDLNWVVSHQIEYVGLSFVRQPEDVIALRTELQRRGVRARIVAKIEKPQAVANLEGIVAEADAVMVARGDLGVELDVAKVPAIQKRIIETCRMARVPVITATQMLNSMESSSRPTRAEASDVFNAVLDGTDAVMLSGETAIGKYPLESVSTMSRIVREAESLVAARGTSHSPWGFNSGFVRNGNCEEASARSVARSSQLLPITGAVVEAASAVCHRLGAALLVVASHSGRTALALSKQRNATPTLALTDDLETARAMALYWGVTPLHVPGLFEASQVLVAAEEWCRQHELIAPGDRVVLLRGVVPNNPSHNAILVHEVE